MILVVPSLGTAYILIGPRPEQLIEGHTVFLTIEAVVNATGEEEFAAAVAVLVRERTITVTNSRFPGVLWFNDQYLIDPDQSLRKQTRNRVPCTGAVIAVNRGDPVDTDLAARWTLNNATYLNESYWITDPNERRWIVDLWNTTHGTLAWTVQLGGEASGRNISKPDDGRANCGAYSDSTCVKAFLDPKPYLSVEAPGGGRPPGSVTNFGDGRCSGSGMGRVHHKDPGDHGMDYPCEGCSDVSYNAVLYFRLKHLTDPNISKDHREGVGRDWWADAAACHDTYTNAWRCADRDDDREGNSHPYNPENPFPLATYSGTNNHGGSDLCGDQGEYIDECHATRDVDIYYGYITDPPLVRTFWLIDLPGADAPYHCHDDEGCMPVEPSV